MDVMKSSIKLDINIFFDPLWYIESNKQANCTKDTKKTAFFRQTHHLLPAGWMVNAAGAIKHKILNAIKDTIS